MFIVLAQKEWYKLDHTQQTDESKANLHQISFYNLKQCLQNMIRTYTFFYDCYSDLVLKCYYVNLLKFLT